MPAASTSSLQVEHGLEADGEARTVPHVADAQQHARHEAGAVQRIVAQGEQLALAAEDDLLVGDQAGQADRVDPHALYVAVFGAGHQLAAGWYWRTGPLVCLGDFFGGA